MRIRRNDKKTGSQSCWPLRPKRPLRPLLQKDPQKSGAHDAFRSYLRKCRFGLLHGGRYYQYGELVT